jgi:hypothetical protein
MKTDAVASWGRLFICLAGGFCLAWFALAGARVTLVKSANQRLLLKDRGLVVHVRNLVARSRRETGHLPAGPGDLVRSGLLDPADMPVEAFSASARWVPRYDGGGGFVYDPATGDFYLNADVKRMKFFGADWDIILKGDLFPHGAVF